MSMRLNTLFMLCVLMIISACGGSGNAGPVPPVTPPITPPSPPLPVSVALSRVFDQLSFTRPVALLQAPNDASRWFVVEKAGVIRVFDNLPQVTVSTVFIDISARVDSGASEAGLLGMAFHPDFVANGQVVLSYTRTGSPLESVISRFRSFDGGGTLSTGSEEILLTVLQDFQNHNGGHVAFGNDGFLYIGFGDGGSANDPNNRAQSTDTLLGKLVRIDVDSGSPFAIPADNPFAGNSLCTQGFGGAPCPEIFAIGLRNPWRFSFDPPTGELWLGDVGQDAFEEVNRITIAGNYGWRIREGLSCANPVSGCQSANLIDPIHAYGRTSGTSITGGYVYRGAAIISLTGRYVFGDAVTGRIWALPLNPVNVASAEELVDSSLFISSFGQSTTGELFAIDYAAGTLHQLINAP